MVERKSSKRKAVEKSVEASLWESANKLRGSVEPAEYNTLAILYILCQNLYKLLSESDLQLEPSRLFE